VTRTLLIAIGNPLRRDDGVAHRVLELLGPQFDGEARSVLQLTPELAAETAGCERVVFLDADAEAAEIQIEALTPVASSPALTHVSTPAEIVALASALFGFTGRAVLWRIPAADFSFHEGLTAVSEAAAWRAASAITHETQSL